MLQTVPKRKMAKVKMEQDDSACEDSDAWLAHWSNASEARIKKEEAYDEKPYQLSIKTEFQEIDDEMEVLSSGSGVETHCVQTSQTRFNLDNKSDVGKKSKSQSRAKAAESKESNIESRNDNARYAVSLKEQLLTATASEKVDNLCKYQCQECKEFHWGRESLSRHFKKTNHAIITQGSLNKYLVEVVAHKCLLCLDKMLCDKATIASHLKRKHNISLKEYAEKTDVVYITRNDRVQSTKIRLEHSQKIMTISEALKHAKVSDVVENQCKYECPKCKSYFKNRKSIYHHLTRFKHAVVATTDFSIRKYLVGIVAHKCHICEEKILCEKEAIINHVKSNHCIGDLKEYCEKYGLQHENNEAKKQIGNGDCEMEDLDSFKSFEETSKVANLCKYKCQACKKVYYTLRSFQRHIIQTKHTSVDKGSIRKHLIEIVAHKCYICSKRVLCDKSYILKHLTKHNLRSLQAYSNATNVKYENKTARRKKEFDTLWSKKSTKKEISEIFANLCKYKCKCCAYSCNSWRYMVAHINTKNHGLDLSPAECAIHVVFYKCKVCECFLLCDTDILRNHARKHNLTLTAYKTLQNVCNDKELLTHYYKELRIAMKNIAMVSPKAQCTLKSSSLPKFQTTSNVGNLCFFKCLLCNKSEMSFGNFSCHLRREHNCKTALYKQENVVEARYHKCLMCARIVLCDNHILRGHLKGHKTNYAQYVKNYVVKVGGKVFPTFQEYRRDRTVFEMLKAT